MERDIKFRKDIHTSSLHEGLKRLDRDEPQIWSDVSKLLYRKSLNINSDYDVPTRIGITKLSSTFTTSSLAEFSGIKPSTAIKIVKETVSAAAFLLGEDNDYFPLENMDEFSKAQYLKFEQMEKKRLELAEKLKNTHIVDLLKTNPALKMIFDRQLEDTAITPLLSELNIEPAENVNSQTRRFLEEGFQAGGTQSLIRNVLFRQWLNAGSRIHNQKGINISTSISKIALAAYTFKLSEGKRNKRSAIRVRERNLCHFLSYVAHQDFLKWIGNYSIDDQFFDLFPISENSFDNFRGVNLDLENNSLNSKAKERLHKFLNKRGTVSINPTVYYLNFSGTYVPEALSVFAERVSSSENRSKIINDIANARKMKTSSARKVYDAGVCLLEHLLLTDSSSSRRFKKEKLKSPVVRDFKKYVELVKQWKENNQ